MTKRMIQILAAGMLSLLAAGCQQSDKPKVSHGEDFPAPDEVRQEQRFAKGKIQNGARESATLYAYHFDGANLNSLGAKKLLAMIEADSGESSLTIYLDVLPDDKLSAARQQSASEYLKDAGLHAEQYRFTYGTNPKDTTFAAPEIANLPKSDSVSDSSSSGSGGGGGSSTGGTSGSSGH